MTDPDDPWSSLAENLGLNNEPPAEVPSEAARGQRRRRKPEDGSEQGEPAPSRGRRRGHKPESADPVISEPQPIVNAPEIVGVSSDAVGLDDGDTPPGEGDQKKRRRRRSRRKKTGEAGTMAEGEIAHAAVADSDNGPSGEEDDITPLDNYSAWNMPSWQELIDGLHKP